MEIEHVTNTLQSQCAAPQRPRILFLLLKLIYMHNVLVYGAVMNYLETLYCKEIKYLQAFTELISLSEQNTIKLVCLY